MRTISSVALPLAAAILGACSSGSSGRLGRLYANLRTDAAQRPASALPDPALEARQDKRAAEVREMVGRGEVKSSTDHLQAAVILVETEDATNLALAEKLAMRAAEMGESRGRRVAAEAVDKQLVNRHMPQRYGTQYEWVPVLHAWRLYPIDPKTTDADRRAMGVPPLTALYADEDRLNTQLTSAQKRP